MFLRLRDTAWAVLIFTMVLGGTSNVDKLQYHAFLLFNFLNYKTMKTLEYSRSNRLTQVLLVVAIAVTLGFGVKFLYEAFRATKDTLEIVHNTVEQIVEDEVATDAIHGNSNDSPKLQIVYEIYGLDSWSTKTVVKYGVSGQKNYKRKFSIWKNC